MNDQLTERRSQMSASSEQILRDALALPPEQRAELVERLLATFQSPDPHLDELWAREAQDRLDAYDRGELKAVSVEEVLNKTRQRREK
jgi:putative addiction module component (TIGR02574 family)